jgi:hypothetical protein
MLKKIIKNEFEEFIDIIFIFILKKFIIFFKRKLPNDPATKN